MISSHILDELGKLANSYGIIHEGRLIDEFTTDELNVRCGRYVKIQTDDNSRAPDLIKQMSFEAAIDSDGLIRVENAIDDTIEINKALVSANIGVRELMIKNISLEDYYLSVTGGAHNG